MLPVVKVIVLVVLLVRIKETIAGVATVAEGYAV